MWQTTHFFSDHGAIQLASELRALHHHVWHALLTRLANPAIVEPVLLAAATILFVLACLGLILVGGAYAH
ncbi:hypothetical protein [Dyella caseinilytica]|uniref:Uncharacterized protein n=1 Tax=Dyella caseinilytica TaxID=1849581 RepID=A0ABX7GZJ5_9GAMM|nr:hypothetical protein [Dyella caseinilytica]QRN55353.1 hypothetical protein ISN74_08530 [Dyella caseinilytica]GGA01107.1 hypothetical protein GCM10011408_22870 [Dyella caseinilytica]